MQQYHLLIKNILLCLLDREASSSELKIWKYYVNTEYDSNVTDFEALSNANRLVLCSCLEPVYVKLLMYVFMAIYDDNYVYFEKECIYSIFYEFKFEEMNNCKNMSESAKKFIEIYEKNNRDVTIDVNEKGDKYIDNIQIYDYIPHILHEFDRTTGNKKQKIYTIERLLKLFNYRLNQNELQESSGSESESESELTSLFSVEFKLMSL